MHCVALLIYFIWQWQFIWIIYSNICFAFGMWVTSVSIPNFTVWMHNHFNIARHDTNTLFAISSSLFTLQSALESHLVSYKYHIIWHVCIIPNHSISFNQMRMKSEMLHVTFVIFVDFGHMPYIPMPFYFISCPFQTNFFSPTPSVSSFSSCVPSHFLA